MTAAALLAVACGTDDTAVDATTTSSAITEFTTTTASTTTSTTVVPAAASDVAYASVSNAQRLDVYLPSTGRGPFALVIIIHGGGWAVGDKRGELPSAAIPGFLDLGYAVASINYRLSGEAVFPAQLLDAKAAVRHLRAQAGALGLDPDRFAVVGESAGGHLAALLGTTGGMPEFDDPALGNAGVSSAVQAVVDFYGPSDLRTADAQRAENEGCPSDPDPAIAALIGGPPSSVPDLATAGSPVTYVTARRDLPPFFIAHGDADCVVPHQQSVALHSAIDAVAPGRSQLLIVPGSGHYLDFDFESVSSALAGFLAATIGSG
jgi:acetyl esterase/lipase